MPGRLGSVFHFSTKLVPKRNTIPPNPAPSMDGILHLVGKFSSGIKNLASQSLPRLSLDGRFGCVSGMCFAVVPRQLYGRAAAQEHLFVIAYAAVKENNDRDGSCCQS